jgi:ABC-type antimicrobial peptide transport system permease subunit
MAVLRYTDVQSRRREIGVARALGATPGWLGVTLVMGGLLIVALALGPAIGLAALLGGAIHLWDPLWTPTLWEPGVLVRGSLLAMLSAVMGSLLPLRQLRRVDPIEIFRR